MQQLFWLLEADGVYMYLHPLNRKYVVSNVDSNAVSNVNDRRTLKDFFNALKIK